MTLPRPAEPDRERLAWTIPEVAAMLGISRSLAYRWVADGILPAFQVGAVKRVPDARLREVIAQLPDRRPA